MTKETISRIHGEEGIWTYSDGGRREVRRQWLPLREILVAVFIDPPVAHGLVSRGSGRCLSHRVAGEGEASATEGKGLKVKTTAIWPHRSCKEEMDNYDLRGSLLPPSLPQI
ncbi:hypothetical protein CRG98_048163 [Punica granatum]|uniref:Uncharacterized protein n=1 Tax=Punica granatum TaxID=22663 RepID=A0A2I0HIX4_PUNGR|nr:hypothetical protein CRG98_048163 [Punica granatum]